MKLSAVIFNLFLLAPAALAAPIDDNEVATGTLERAGRIVGGSEANHTNLCRNRPEDIECMISKEASTLRSKQCAKYGQGSTYHLWENEKNRAPIECQNPFCQRVKVKNYSNGKKRVQYKGCGPGQNQMAPFYRPALESVCRRMREQGKPHPSCAGIGETDGDTRPVFPPRTRPASSAKNREESTQETAEDDDDRPVFPPRARPASSAKTKPTTSWAKRGVLPEVERPGQV